MTAPEHPEASLQGLGILVTRPALQAGPLVRLIEAAGGTAIVFPTIEIAPPEDLPALYAVLDDLDAFDLAIFVSVNAVGQTFRWLNDRKLGWPSKLPVASVGLATARALERAGVTGAIAPTERFDSEALLALPILQRMANRRVVIFRGEGGRALLGDTLRARGADVTYAQSYRRHRPTADPTPLVQALAERRVHVVSLTSTDGLRNLYDLLDAESRRELLQTQPVAFSQAQAAVCRELGFAQPTLLAANATDEAILETIKAWRLRRFSL